MMMKEVAKLHSHLVKFNMLIVQVVNAGEKLENEENALFLLRSVPKSYNLLVQTLLVDKTTLNLNDVTKLLLESYRRLESKTSDCTGKILVIKDSFQRRNRDRHGGDPKSRSKLRSKDDNE